LATEKIPASFLPHFPKQLKDFVFISLAYQMKANHNSQKLSQIGICEENENKSCCQAIKTNFQNPVLF